MQNKKVLVGKTIIMFVIAVRITDTVDLIPMMKASQGLPYSITGTDFLRQSVVKFVESYVHEVDKTCSCALGNTTSDIDHGFQQRTGGCPIYIIYMSRSTTIMPVYRLFYEILFHLSVK